MWQYEYALETSSPAAPLWERWSDMASWSTWNAGVTAVEADGPFASGTTFRMTLPDSTELPMTLTEVVPGQSFTDVLDTGDFAVTTVHRLDQLPEGRTRIVYRTEITGPAAEAVGPELGPQITSD